MIYPVEGNIQLDPDAGQLVFDNEAANEFTPDNYHINSDGSISIAVPACSSPAA